MLKNVVKILMISYCQVLVAVGNGLLGLFMGTREACVAEHLLCGHAVIKTTMVIISLPIFLILLYPVEVIG